MTVGRNEAGIYERKELLLVIQTGTILKIIIKKTFDGLKYKLDMHNLK